MADTDGKRAIKTRTIFVRHKACELTGFTAISGNKYIRVRFRGRTGWAALASFAGSSLDFVSDLKRQGIIIIGTKACQAIRECVAGIERFVEKPLLERPGWTGSYFALPSGKVFRPKGERKPIVLFEATPGKFAKSGTHKRWLKRVAEPLAGQRLPSFVLMLAFTGPLLDLLGRDGNFGFELVGPKGKGKTTLQMIMASAFGRAHPSAGGTFLMSCRATVNGLEASMPLHADISMILDDASLFSSAKSKQARADDFNDFVFSLYSGRTKARFNTPHQEHFRFTYLLSANERLAEVLDGNRATVSEAACDRLISIPIDEANPYGVFENVLDYKGSGELARTLTNALENNHGHAVGRFLRQLVQARSDDELGLRAKIEGYIEAFQTEVGVDPNDGSTQRITTAFGLVYAAGLLAKAYGALPASIKCASATKSAYLRHLSAGTPRSFRDRLVSLSLRPDVVDLDKAGLVDMSKKDMLKPAAFLRTNRAGERELLLTRKALMRAFPDWLQIRDGDDVKAVLRAQGDRKRGGSQCRVRKNKNKDRVYIFALDCLDGDYDG